MPKILVCHPDVLREVRYGTRLYHCPEDFDVDLNRIEVRTHHYMDKYQKTGRYVLPDGACVLPEDVIVSDRFTEYGYDDIWYLLWAGIIHEEQSPLFYIMDDVSDFYLCNPKLFNPLEHW